MDFSLVNAQTMQTFLAKKALNTVRWVIDGVTGSKIVWKLRATSIFDAIYTSGAEINTPKLNKCTSFFVMFQKKKNFHS